MMAFVFFLWAGPFIVAEVDGDAIVSDRSLARKSFGESFAGGRGGDIFEKFSRTIVARSLIQDRAKSESPPPSPPSLVAPLVRYRREGRTIEKQ